MAAANLLEKPWPHTELVDPESQGWEALKSQQVQAFSALESFCAVAIQLGLTGFSGSKSVISHNL